MAQSQQEGDGDSRLMDTNENPVIYSASSDVFRVNLERHRTFMEGRMDPDHGLVDRLLEIEAIDNIQVQIIDAEKVPFMKSRKILDIILEGNASEKIEKIEKFCEALRYTKQQHLVNYVEANGVYVSKFAGDWPLGKREINIIDKNVTFLKRKLDTSGGLLAEMLKYNTITQWQEESVSEQQGNIQKNTALLDIIRRGSLSDYRNTIDRLTETGQGHLAAILREGGTVVQLHSKATGEVPIIKEGEAEIVMKLLKVMPEKSAKEIDHLLELARLKNLGLIDAVVSESIDLFFLCKNLSAFLRLLELLKNKELQRIVEVIYNKFIPTSTRIEVTLTWDDDEFNKIKHSLQEMESTRSEPSESSEPPIEMESSTHPESLVAPVAGSSQSGKTSLLQSGPEEEAVMMMDTQHEKLGESKVERSELKDEEIIPAIIRNNMDYFTEHIKPKLLINKLHALGIIRDERMRHLRSMSYESEKNYEVLNIIRAASTDKYADFVRCLRETDQNMVADVAEKGGDNYAQGIRWAKTVEVTSNLDTEPEEENLRKRKKFSYLTSDDSEVVLKVKVTHEPAESPDDIQKDIVQKLKQLQDKTVPKSENVWRFLSQLKRFNIEIVSSRWDKGVVMWFWCRSQTALDRIESMNRTEEVSMKGSTEATSGKPEFHKFTTLLNGLFTLLLSGKTPPTISSVFLDNPDKDVVCQKLSEDFSGDEDIKVNAGERSVLSAAKLENKIYVLCQNPTSALVFEEADLTEPRVELPVEGISVPVDMALSNKSNCLYITESSKHRVWKITLSSPENKVEVWLDSGAGDPFTLSVTNDGRVVMVKRGSPPSLDIYDPDAKLLLPLNLPTPMLKPNHAVETSKGNLIVSYDSVIVDRVQAGICEITKAGQIISRFDTTFESINGVAENVNTLLARLGGKNLFGFKYLAIDDKDQVHACSDGTDGLICLDSRLKLETTIRKDELNCPVRVQYVRQESQLIVVDTQHPNLVFILKAK